MSAAVIMPGRTCGDGDRLGLRVDGVGREQPGRRDAVVSRRRAASAAGAVALAVRSTLGGAASADPASCARR
jgi:hypothetical protein